MGQKIALVLSSGGCRGLAHVGVIEGLLSDGYEITSISGSSIGALIGGIYASGNLEKFKNWVCNIDEVDIFDLMDFTFTKQGFIKAERFFLKLQEFIGVKTFGELSLPLTVIATDIVSRKKLAFDSGNLLLAIRASVAIPTIVTPVLYKNMILVDGGVIDPIPAEDIKRFENDQLVICDVNAIEPYSKPDYIELPKVKKPFSLKRKTYQYFKTNIHWSPKSGNDNLNDINYLSVVDKTFDTMQDQICKLTIETCNPFLKINVSRNAATTFEFYRAQELIEAGRTAYYKAKLNSLQSS